MAVVVCDRCGWNRKVTERDAGRKVMCPDCGIYLNPPEPTTDVSWSIWLIVGTVVAVVVLGLLTCAGIIAVAVLA